MSEREEQLESELKEANLKIRLLEEKIDSLVRSLFSKKSEKLDPNQLTLLEDISSKKDEAPIAAETEQGAERCKSAKRKSPRGPRIPEHLPVKEEILDPEEVIAAPDQWRHIGEEVSEQLDYQPAKFWKRRLVRRKYASKANPFSPPIIAPLPEGLQERCLATSELITQVVLSKYADHLPLYRQESIYRSRYGVNIPRQTLCRWVELAASWLDPVYNEMIRQQRNCSYLQIDETPIQYLKPGNGETSKGYFWVSNQPGGDVIFHWETGRAASCLKNIVPADFQGTLQCDGYSVYPSFVGKHEKTIKLAACWAHARRKLYEARARDPVACNWILKQIAQLYQIEKRLREQRAGPFLRAAIRASESAMIIKRIQKALMIVRPRCLPKSGLGNAIKYAFEQWDRLQVFLSNGAVEIDNNLVENAIRPTKIGAKNWMFIGSEGSGKTSAILFSIVESAKRNGLDPHWYINELLNHLPQATNKQVPMFTPKAIAKSMKARAMVA